MITFPLLFLQYDKFAWHFYSCNFCSISSLLLLIKHNIPNNPSVKRSKWNNSISINCILKQLWLIKSMSTYHSLFYMLPFKIFFISHASCKYVLLLLLLNFLIEETVEIAMGHIHVQFTDFFTSFSNWPIKS